MAVSGGKVKSNVVKNNIAQKPGVLASMNQRLIVCGQAGDERVDINVLGISEIKWMGMSGI